MNIYVFFDSNFAQNCYFVNCEGENLSFPKNKFLFTF